MAVATSTPNILTGELVAIKVGSAYAYADSGNVKRQVVSVDVTNGRSKGFRQVRSGIRSADVSLSCVYNGDDPPTGIVEGAYVAVILDTAGYMVAPTGGTTPVGRYISIYCMIQTITDTWNVANDYKWSMDLQSSGEYTAVENQAVGGAVSGGSGGGSGS